MEKRGKRKKSLLYSPDYHHISIFIPQHLIFFNGSVSVTICTRSSDPFYIVTYYINQSLLGHTVSPGFFGGNRKISDRGGRELMIFGKIYAPVLFLSVNLWNIQNWQNFGYAMTSVWQQILGCQSIYHLKLQKIK